MDPQSAMYNSYLPQPLFLVDAPNFGPTAAAPARPTPMALHTPLLANDVICYYGYSEYLSTFNSTCRLMGIPLLNLFLRCLSSLYKLYLPLFPEIKVTLI